MDQQQLARVLRNPRRWPADASSDLLEERLGEHRKNWTIADDGSMYTLPLGSEKVEVGRIQ